MWFCILSYAVDGSEWPFTKNIIDLVRCSVVFDNSKDLLNGIRTFNRLVTANETGCIIEILRIKNGFKDFKNLSDKNDDLKQYDYRDVKFNVLIAYGKMELVGEVQFLLKCMLLAKKIGHSVYSFVRNEYYYKEIAFYLSDRYKMNDSMLNPIILSKNISLFSNMLENCNTYDKENYFLKQENEICTFLKESHFTKGLKLFQLFVKKWKL